MAGAFEALLSFLVSILAAKDLLNTRCYYDGEC